MPSDKSEKDRQSARNYSFVAGALMVALLLFGIVNSYFGLIR